MKQGALDFDPPIQPEPQFYGPGYDPVLYVAAAFIEAYLVV